MGCNCGKKRTSTAGAAAGVTTYEVVVNGSVKYRSRVKAQADARAKTFEKQQAGTVTVREMRA